MGKPKVWSPAEDRKLKAAIDEGLSSGEISYKIFKRRRTRSAVCGRAAKKGWRIISQKVRITKTHKGFERQTFRITRSFDRSAAEAVLALDDRQCRWPIEVDGKFEFCQNNREPGISYCAHHHKVSVAPAQPAGIARQKQRFRMKQHH